MYNALSHLLSTLSEVDFCNTKNPDSIKHIKESIINALRGVLVEDIQEGIDVSNPEVILILDFCVIFLRYLTISKMSPSTLNHIQDSMCLALSEMYRLETTDSPTETTLIIAKK